MIPVLGDISGERSGKRYRVLVYCVVTVCLMLAHAYWQWVAYHSWQVPRYAIKKDIAVEGDIVSLPKRYAHAERFLFKVARWHNIPIKSLWQLSWYGRHPALHVGQRWQFTVRIKPPHGLHNFGQIDPFWHYLRLGIQATGSVRAKFPVRMLRSQTCCRLERWRETVQQHIQQAAFNATQAALLAALTIGSRVLLQPQHWQVLQNTGTSHLVAISGLHVGLVSWFVYQLMRACWQRVPCLLAMIAAPQAASIGALIAALAYSALAGLSLPTQRALIMIGVWLLAQFSLRPVAHWHRLGLAFCLMVIWQPFCFIAPGFWLSFVAVASLAYVFSARMNTTRGLSAWLKMQLIVTLALMPLSLFFFQRFSLLSIPVNVIAIPWVGFVIVPLCFVMMLCLVVSPELAHGLIKLSATLVSPWWWFLKFMATWHNLIWIHAIYQYWILGAATVALGLLLAPKAWPGRLLGALWFAPLFFYEPPRPPMGAVWLNVLDVGQGLAMVIRTQHHTLVYDTGPRYGSGFDAGKMVLLPALRRLGVKRLDGIVVSHGDIDHRGGLAALWQAFPAPWLLTSAHPLHELPKNVPQYRCQQGQHWQWDGVKLSLLSPPVGAWVNTNNASCVLRVATAKAAILLPGDIEAPAERWLVQHQAERLAATILIAPHHGSRSSSTWPFIQHVHPRWVVVASGDQNRFHFPHKKVLKRYQRLGATVLNTAKQGALLFRVNARGEVKCDSFKVNNPIND